LRYVDLLAPSTYRPPQIVANKPRRKSGD